VIQEANSTSRVANLRSRYVMAGGVKTHYWEAGENGPTILALHGGGAGTSGGAGMGLLLPLLADRFRVIAVDSVGGFGFTDVAAPAPYGVQSRVDHLEAVVDALCLDEKCALIGNSQGAWVAARYAILHPDRVSKMALIASATIGAAMGIPEEFTPAFKLLAGYDFSREGMVKLMEALVYDRSRVTDELVDLRFASASRPGTRAALAGFAAGGRYLTSDVMRASFDMRESLPAITKHVPTVFFWGEQDAFAPVKLGHQLDAMLPDVPFHYVDKAGHQVQTDRPEAIARTLLEFF
jgi:pimeloyl-ACP methyl ester carboxylesterase